MTHRHNVMQRRHYEQIADCMKGIMTETNWPDECYLAFTKLAKRLKGVNSNMNLERFLNAAGLTTDSTTK